MPYTYTLSALIPASPQDIYDTWLDSRGHSAMTGGKAVQSARIGDSVSAWGDYITGRNLHLEPGRRIVQTWRTTHFTDAHGDSVITVTLTKIAGGTRVTLNHANVPDDHTRYEESGWKDHYFTPMQRYFMTMTGVAEVIARAKRTAGSPARKTTIKNAKQAARKAAGKTVGKKKTAKAAAGKPSWSTARKKKAKKAAAGKTRRASQR